MPARWNASSVDLRNRSHYKIMSILNILISFIFLVVLTYSSNSFYLSYKIKILISIITNYTIFRIYPFYSSLNMVFNSPKLV